MVERKRNREKKRKKRFLPKEIDKADKFYDDAKSRPAREKQKET